MSAVTFGQLEREHILLITIVLLSGSYAYFSMAHSQLYIDEITFARVGYSLIQGHLASDSALLPIYEKFGLVRSDIYTPFGYLDSVEPWLDHPPLVPLLLVPILIVDASPRLLPVIISCITTLLIFFLLRDRRILAWASALTWVGFFVTHPILSMLFLDSGVSFFSLLTVTLLGQYARNRSMNQLYLAAIASGAAALSKVFGIATILYFSIYLLSNRFGMAKDSMAKNSKPFLLAVGIASIWPLYGLATAAPLFIQLLQFNASRSVLSGNIFSFPIMASFNYSQSMMCPTGIDPALVIGWIAMGYSSLRKNLLAVQAFPLSYLLVVLGLRYGWFYTLIPLFPFFAIGIGTIVADVISLTQTRIHCKS